MNKFTEAYIVAAFWSTTDESTPEGGDFLDENYGLDDLAPETLERMKADCDKFQAENTQDIDGREEQAGHDFLLTRQHAGCGFWDGDWQEPAATRLTKASHSFHECYLYVGDDNSIYIL